MKGKHWRLSNPDIEPSDRSRLVKDLMDARRAVKDAKAAGSHDDQAEAHRRVDEAKRALGERGPVWWRDGAREHAVRQMVFEIETEIDTPA